MTVKGDKVKSGVGNSTGEHDHKQSSTPSHAWNHWYMSIVDGRTQDIRDQINRIISIHIHRSRASYTEHTPTIVCVVQGDAIRDSTAPRTAALEQP